MLVVSKKLGESVWLGEAIEVKVLAVRGGSVRLGIEAPDSVDVRKKAPGGPKPVPAAQPSGRDVA